MSPLSSHELSSGRSPSVFNIGRRTGCLLLVLLLCLVVLRIPAPHASLMLKDYIIRYDRGWDVLCEPYVVQKDDWVLKIFRQKGEIAHTDFREFLGVFKRLNPHIVNIDRIRPGQTIDIPLKKLEHGALAGQASGIVTIPFVTLAKVTDIIKQHTRTYRVRKGDTVSQLIARQYGRFGTRSYTEAVKMFQAANPQIKNIDRIFAGQKVYLPDPSIRDKAWYASLFDEGGNLKETLKQPGAKAAAPAAPTAAATPVPQAPVEEQVKPNLGPVAETAATIGGKLYNKGTYFFPRQGADDFELDVSRFPVIDLQNGTRIVMTREDKVMDVDAEVLRNYWQDVKIIEYSEQSNVPEILAAIFAALDETASSDDVGFVDQGVQVQVRARWVKTEKDNRQLCITPIGDSQEKTPEGIRRYLEQHDIVLREILPDGSVPSEAGKTGTTVHPVQNITAITPTGQKDFVQRLMHQLGFAYAPNVAISFPYAGIQVKAVSNMVSTGTGQDLLVDFGDLYGDAVKAIRTTGLQVVQISSDDTYLAATVKLMGALGLTAEENPVFPAARRSSPFNVSVSVRGVLAHVKGRPVLLSGAVLAPAVSELVSTSGVDIIVW